MLVPEPRTLNPEPSIASIDQLDDLLSEPTPGVIDTLSKLPGDLLILGVGGKMGPTLARMAARASQEAGAKRRIVGVARFTDPNLPAWLQKHGVEPLTCDLLDPKQLAALPDAENIIAMPALKFGSSARPADTWAVNCWLPAQICQRYQASRIAAFSTGNVYPLTPIARGDSAETGPKNLPLPLGEGRGEGSEANSFLGSTEIDPLAPVGEYAASCVGRERMYDYFSRTAGTPISILRLNYACELRYGVLVDLAQQIVAGQPIDLSMPAVNVIWQGDANAIALQSLAHAASPPFVLNIAGPQTLLIRALANQLGQLLGKSPTFTGAEGKDALLSNSTLSQRLFGPPRISTDQLLRWTAHWLNSSGPLLGKPTKFQVRDGKF